MMANTHTIEHGLGKPWDCTNPLGFAACLHADETGHSSREAEARLDDLGVGAMLTPRALGGSLGALDALMLNMRALFRRDPCIGLGYAGSSFIASVNVWLAGSPAQRAHVAEQLANNGKIACAYHELEHGNDFSSAAFRATVRNDTLVLNGHKQVVSNIERAQTYVLFARTDRGKGARDHSVLLIDRTALEPRAVDFLPRVRTSGMRSVVLAGFELRDATVPRDTVIGELGQGIEIALRSFQITRMALPGMFLGAVDTALRLAIRFARERKLYGASILQIPRVRATIADAFANVLLADCLVTVGARSLHELPRMGSLYAATVKSIVPQILLSTMRSIGTLLGASGYLRAGGYGLFQKLARDIRPISFGHASRANCLATILPQLPRLARKAWQPNVARAPRAVFAWDTPLRDFDPTALSLSTGGHDPIVGSFEAAASELQAASGGLAAFIHPLRAGFAAIRDDAAALSPHDCRVGAPSSAYDLAHRYAVLFAASSAMHTGASSNMRTRGFTAQPHWLAAALANLTTMLGAAPPTRGDDVTDALVAEALRRFDEDLSFDFHHTPIAPWNDDR